MPVEDNLLCQSFPKLYLVRETKETVEVEGNAEKIPSIYGFNQRSLEVKLELPSNKSIKMRLKNNQIYLDIISPLLHLMRLLKFLPEIIQAEKLINFCV